MSSHEKLTFHFPNVLGQTPNKIYRQGDPPGLDKPEGFRIPLIYFSWGLLEGDRSLHHHPDNDELLLVLGGRAKVRLVGPGKEETRFDETYEVSEGDIVLFPQGWVHSVEDLGSEDDKVKVLVIFNNQDFKAVEVEFDQDKMCPGENALM